MAVEQSKHEPTVDWAKVDKTRFFFNALGAFTGVTIMLFPLSVLKTRRMVLPNATFSQVLREDGVPGLYKGLSVVLCGSIPSRMLYLSSLEVTKQEMRFAMDAFDAPAATKIAVADFAAGACASTMAQVVIVPVDVISQTMMIRSKAAPGGAPPPGAVATVREILRVQGVRGLYRGVGMSLATFVPSSALWWGAYGAYQRVFAGLVPPPPPAAPGAAPPPPWQPSPGGRALALQVGAGVAAGLTSGLLTTPLDVLKVRLQTQTVALGERPLSLRGVAEKLLREEGPRGLLRGALPRMASVALWGTAMVSAYEQVKRVSVLTDS